MRLPPVGYTLGGLAAMFLTMRAYGYVRRRAR